MNEPVYRDALVTLYAGDCVEVMAALPEASVDAIVTDPPYHLGFMGKRWDEPGAFVERRSNRRASTFEAAQGNHNPVDAVDAARTRRVENHRSQAWHQTWAEAAFCVLKPGGHLLAFGGTRTHHRLMCALEDGGFEIRDCLMWLYGSGFPKSLDVSKAIDKAAGAPREQVPATGGLHASRLLNDDGWSKIGAQAPTMDGPVPATEAARRWEGWGTALKPAWEPIILARKPLAEPTVAANVQQYGTGALNVDGCRIAAHGRPKKIGAPDVSDALYGAGLSPGSRFRGVEEPPRANGTANLGRWPANLVLDEAAAALLDAQSGELPSGGSGDVLNRRSDKFRNTYAAFAGERVEGALFGDRGGASRFFYTSKASTEDRDGSRHPTVKPVALMKWLLRLVTPPGGTVLDPFAGSGTTVFAAAELGLASIGIERDGSYLADAIFRLRQSVFAFPEGDDPRGGGAIMTRRHV